MSQWDVKGTDSIFYSLKVIFTHWSSLLNLMSGILVIF